MRQKVEQDRIKSTSLLECTFNTLEDGVIVCDHEEKILLINAAALQLFEVSAGSHYKETPYRQFLHAYEVNEGEQQAISLEPWLLSLITHRDVATGQQEEITVLRVPSGRRIYADIHSLAVAEAQKCAAGMVYVVYDITRRYRQALRLQRVYQAIVALKESIAHIPEPVDFAFSERTFLLSPPVIFVAQQLVDLIHQILDFQYVCLLAFGPPSSHQCYVMGSHFSAEQEKNRRKIHGCYLSSDFLDEITLTRLSANQEVILPIDRLPPECREDSSIKKLLLIPLFLEQQLVGALVIARGDGDSQYRPEEIELVKVVATQVMLIIECLRALNNQVETRAKVMTNQEIDGVVNNFLNLASHEMNTSLTMVKGNIQIAQRRLTKLKRQLEEQPEQVSEKIDGVLSPLASAVASARLEERSIQDLVDDARIQNNTFELHMQRLDLLVLLRQVVASEQRLALERTIELHLGSAEQEVPVIADAERISRVIHDYLFRALRSSPSDAPVTVQLTVEEGVARVSVHDERIGIPLEEQQRIWERFYYARRVAEDHEPDLSSELGLYLSKTFIERHHGHVGVQSDSGHGATFWFTLPVDVDEAR
jgi:signal transduction histidine kinase